MAVYLTRTTVSPLVVAGLCILLGACGATAPAPVEDRSRPAERAEAPEDRDAAPDGQHLVARGDTLYSIAFDHGLDWRDLASWNEIGSPYLIYPGQALRLSPDQAPPPDRLASAPDDGPSEPEPAEPEPADTEPEVASVPASAPEAPAEEEGEAPRTDSDGRDVAGVTWHWPTEGSVSRNFDPSSDRKGIEISGSEGQAVRAAADGQVVYSGTGLLGYGELVIIKHTDALLSAYAHNRDRSVSEGDQVRAGDRIARLGRNERDEELLHFEIRRNGDPEDPLVFLPPMDRDS